jgi:formylmethanofuran dehydrogenase subunit E
MATRLDFGQSAAILRPLPSTKLLACAARFHGHLGPWLALGLKAGLHARRKLRATPFTLTAKVFCPSRTPYTCFIDGIQFGCGCTLGKGNISHVRSPRCRVEFTRTAPERARLVLRLRPEVWAELLQSKPGTSRAVAALGRAIHRRPVSALFLAGSAPGR